MTLHRSRRVALVAIFGAVFVDCYEDHVWNLPGAVVGPTTPRDSEHALYVRVESTRPPRVHVRGENEARSEQAWEPGKPQGFLLPPGSSLSYVEIEGECPTDVSCARGGSRWTKCTPDPSEKVSATIEEITMWRLDTERRDPYPLERASGARYPAERIELTVEPALPSLRVSVRISRAVPPSWEVVVPLTCSSTEEAAGKLVRITCDFREDSLLDAKEVIAKVTAFGRCPSAAPCSPPPFRIGPVVTRGDSRSEGGTP